MRLFFVCTTAILACACTHAAEPVPRPNVLFILCDDLRPDALGCYGSRHVKTPRDRALTGSYHTPARASTSTRNGT